MGSWRRSGWSDRRGAAAIEFALVAVPFLATILFIFALCLHFYYQELLDMGLHVALRKIQTGNAQNIADGNAFIASYLCPAMGNLVTCSNLYVRVQKANMGAGQDYYNITTGILPMAGGALDLGAYSSAKFCNAGSSQFVLVTAIYVAPTVIGWLVPNVFSVSIQWVTGRRGHVPGRGVYRRLQRAKTNGTPAPSC